MLLGLYYAHGKLDHVGFTATITDEERPSLTKRLEALREAPGFTGKAPGGPSRWSTERSGEWEPLRPGLVVEVRFDQSPAIDFATERSWCAGGQIRRRINADRINADRLSAPPEKECSRRLQLNRLDA